jgi:hypothetical protein
MNRSAPSALTRMRKVVEPLNQAASAATQPPPPIFCIFPEDYKKPSFLRHESNEVHGRVSVLKRDQLPYNQKGGFCINTFNSELTTRDLGQTLLYSTQVTSTQTLLKT